jgi:hypothetical protein
MEAAGDFADLCFHALAHVPLPGHTSLHDPAYVAWARTALPEDASAPIREDAAVFASLYAEDPRSEHVQALPLLFSSIAELRAVAVRPLRDLAPADVADAGALAALRRVDERLAEALFADLALMAPSFADAYARVIVPEVGRGIARVAPHLAEARALSPELAAATVRASIALGARGRAFGAAGIFVGVPTDWNDVTHATPAVLALHEQAVHDAARDGDPSYARTEWAALVSVAKLLVEAGADLRSAHGAWIASLDLAPLVAEAVALGLCSAADARRIAAEPRVRSYLLASL